MRRTGAVSTANIVHTPEHLERLLDEKPACWPLAAFTSVVFQRWADVEERRVQQVLATRTLSGERLETGDDVAQFVVRYMRDVDDLAGKATVSLATPAYLALFGDSAEGGSADGTGIVRVAHELGDHYERFLELAEEFQSCSVPDRYAELIVEGTQFMNLPLRDFGDFLENLLECFEKLQQRASWGRDVRVDPVPLRFTTDERLIRSIIYRLHAIE